MIAKWLSQADMGDQPPAKKSARALAGSIDKLVRHDEMTGRDFLAKTADRADRNNPLDAQLLHGENVGAKVNLRGQPAMSFTVTRLKHQIAVAELAAHELIGRFAERCSNRYFAYSFEAFHLIQAAAADDADDWLTHNNLVRRDRLGGTGKFTLRLPLKLTAGCRDVVAARPAQIDLYLV